MPVQIGDMDSEVTVIDGELPLNERQVEKLVQMVIKHLQKEQHEAQSVREATTLRRGAAPPARVRE